MKRIALALTLLVIVTCSSSDPYEPPPRRMARPARAAMDLDPLPPPSWWRDHVIAEPLNLTNDQMKELDRVAAELGQQEIQQLQRDTLTAARDLQSVLELEKPSSDEIISAGQRVRSLRSEISDRQIKLLAAERLVLTREQWQKLQEQLRDDRMPGRRMEDDWRRGRGGRGGWGGRGPGRRPGF